ncbi:MAG: DNA replication terminus site-binding protein [Thalassotalea sp.]
MGDIFQLTKAMDKLISLNNQLKTLCSEQKPAFIGFDIEKISAENETKTLRDGIHSLDVKTLHGNNPNILKQVLNSWASFYKADGFSTKFVDRLPGVVVITRDVDKIKLLIDHINDTKDNIAAIIRTDRDQYERHKFIHDTFNFIMTEQVYRHVHYFEQEVTNVWFNWASRPVPKTYTIEQALEMLDEQLNRPKYLFSQDEWQTMITATMVDVKSGMFDYIQQIKEYRVLPTIEFQYQVDTETKKRKKSNATTPVILLGQPINTLPKFSVLKSYEKKHKEKEVKLSANKTLINPYLKLAGVKKIN